VAGRYFIETFGCQMNVHDSERIAGLLERDGLEPAADERGADVIVINTCSVREKAEEKLYVRLADLKRRRDATIAVTGCVAQQEGERIAGRAPHVHVVAGTQQLKALPDLIRAARATGTRRVDVSPHDDVSFPLGVARHADPVRALVTIIEGCNEFCAFCVVPYTRGHERMRPVAGILADVEHAAASGRVEVQLLGQIVNHYQAPDDPSCDFAGLLERVSAVDGIRRIRFASPHPRHVGGRLVAALRDLPKVSKHLHLPVQSGSNRVLRAMRRRYSREQYLEQVATLRAEVPGIDLSSDIIVGFSGETDRDFDDTLSLVRASRYHSIFSFKYSVRPNTLAAKRMPDDVAEGEKTRRIMALQALQRDIQTEVYAERIGTTVEVLVDAGRDGGGLGGRTHGNMVVNFAGPAAWLGRIIPVRITAATPFQLRGEAVTPDRSPDSEARC
jgi:tRNA-2-methylthio-N6-dimethylallyladenosine synthase